MRGTRKVVKDAMPLGMNRGEAEDKRAQKMGELSQFSKDNGRGLGGLQQVVDGFALYDYRCTACGAVNKGPRQPLYAIPLPCASCGLKTEQERVRNNSQ